MNVKKVENINTKFNLYHKYVCRKYKKKTIKAFNKELKSTVKEGRTSIQVSSILPWTPTLTGTKKVAAKLGVTHAIEDIEKIYPMEPLRKTIIGDVHIFRIPKKLKEEDNND